MIDIHLISRTATGTRNGLQQNGHQGQAEPGCGEAGHRAEGEYVRQEANRDRPTRRRGSKSRSEPKPLVLRVPPEVLDRVERLAELRRPRVSRHHWLLEAVYEKLEREDRREDD